MLTELYSYIESSMPQYLQSLGFKKNCNTSLLLTVLRSIIQQHLTIMTAYISDYIKPLPKLSCLESRLISELQGAPGSRDHQASPSSLFGYQNTTTTKRLKPKRVKTQPFYIFSMVTLWPFGHSVTIWSLCDHLVTMWPYIHSYCNMRRFSYCKHLYIQKFVY